MRVIVRLFTRGRNFSAVHYNMDKVNQGDAKLLTYKNFGIVHAICKPSASDFKSYLEAVTALNYRSRCNQFHAVLSLKGKSDSLQSFEEFAICWLKEMGYEKQPYLIFAHFDTSNTHLHIVSTNVTLNGSKISDSFDRPRAMSAVHKVLGIDPQHEFRKEIGPLFSYRYANIDEFRMLLNGKGYRNYTANGVFNIAKYGKILLRVSAEKINNIIANHHLDDQRVQYIREVINNHLTRVDNTPEPHYQLFTNSYSKRVCGFSSELSRYLLHHHQLEIHYLFNDLDITGFVAIDHNQRVVMNGSVLMDLQRLISPLPQSYHSSKTIRR